MDSLFPTEADKGHWLSLPSCRFLVVASKLSLPFLEGLYLLQCGRWVGEVSGESITTLKEVV